MPFFMISYVAYKGGTVAMNRLQFVVEGRDNLCLGNFG